MGGAVLLVLVVGGCLASGCDDSLRTLSRADKPFMRKYRSTRRRSACWKSLEES